MASRRPPADRAVARRVAKLTALHAQLRVELNDVEPLVWRRILVPETITLPKLHGALIGAMGWLGGHLHEYEIARQRYGVPDDEWPDPEPLIDERRVRLKPLLDTGLRRFTYVYDLGDHWEHSVIVEDLVIPTPGLPPVRCLAGENACPPEDVGSAGGYADFLEILRDPTHEEHASMLKWVGGSFDPAAFSLDDVNERLADIKA
jgi:hypothetical protein